MSAAGPRIPRDEYQGRLAALQRRMADSGLDVFLVSAEDSIYYLTGVSYRPLERPFFIIVRPTADAVLLADDPSRVVTAIAVSRRTLGLARQSIWAGLGLSACAMAAASLGYVPPTLGAVLQEVIDVGVILNALRAAAGRETRTGR